MTREFAGSLGDAEVLLAGAAALPPLVQDIGVSFLTAGLLSIVFTRLRIPTIAAFLCAGVIVGPIGARLVTDESNIETISSLGLILLLFLIGLEIDLRKLLTSGKILLVTGLFQFPICVLFGFAAASALAAVGIGGALLAGGGASAANYAPVYFGFVVAASSTLIVAKLFQESFQLDTTVGRISLGLLIFQDIWAIVVIAIQPNFADPQIAPILMTFVGVGVLIGIAILLARFVLPIGFRWIAKIPELMLVGAIAWCFGMGFLGSNFDQITELLFGLNLHMAISMEMGALIAGATIASLPYSTEVIGGVGIVRDFFVTLFFVGLGMGIPVPEGPEVLLLAVILSVVVIAARFFIFFPLLYWTGLYRRNAMVAAVRLAQVSEFSLVIAYVGIGFGHISAALASSIIFAFVITALLTPSLFKQADAIHDRLAPILDRLGFGSPPVASRAEEEEAYDVALLGFHRVASSLLHELHKHKPELLERLLVVDFNVNIHHKIAAYGATVKYGDLSHPETLHHAGVDKAKVIVCTVQDDVLKGTSNRKIVEILQRINPHATIIANAIEFREARSLYEAGAEFVHMPRVVSAQSLLTAILSALEGKIEAHRAEREVVDGRYEDRGEVFT